MKKILERSFNVFFSSSLNIYQIVSLLLIASACYSVLSYLIVYSFLFGYYFGGNSEISFSNFEVYRNFIPFHINTILTTSIMLTLSIAIIFNIGKLLTNTKIKRNKLSKFIAIIVFLFLHFSFSNYFLAEVSYKSILFFSIIWLIPIFLLLILNTLVKFIVNPDVTALGLVWGIVIILAVSIASIALNKNIDENIFQLLFIFIIFISSGFADKIYINKYSYFFISFPFTIFFTLTILYLISTFGNFSIISTRIIVIAAFIIFHLTINYTLKLNFSKKIYNKIKTEKTEISISSIKENFLLLVNNKERSYIIFPTVLVVTVLIFVLIPHSTLGLSKAIRDSIPTTQSFDEITILDQQGNNYTIKGWIVTEDDGIIYISDESFLLREVRAQNFIVNID